MQFVGRKVIAGFEKRAQNGIALTGLFQAYALQMFVQDLLSFTHHLARDRWLIIDAILQHGGRTESRIPSAILKMKFIFSAGPHTVEYNQRFA